MTDVKSKSEENKPKEKSVMRTRTRKRENLPLNKEERRRSGLKIWTAFYRQNIHRFCVDYLGLNLYTFQLIMLYMMDRSMFSCFITSRGLSKSFTTAVYCCARVRMLRMYRNVHRTQI